MDDRKTETLIFVTPHIVRGYTSLGLHSATSKGQDLPFHRIREEFRSEEMGEEFDNFEKFEKNKEPFLMKEQQLIRDSERRSSSSVVEKQMTQALDAMSPEVVDAAMKQSLDALGAEKPRA